MAACAQPTLRQDAAALYDAGQYEAAVTALEQGAQANPGDASLRSALLQARAQGALQLLAAASAARLSGRLEESERLLRRAAALDPSQRRVQDLLADLETERRQAAAQADAEAWLQQGRPDLARPLIDSALKDNPRHAGLAGLQRRLDMEARQAQLKASQHVLAETRPISLDFREANLRTVLDVVSRNSGINFVLDRDIRTDSRVTVYIREAAVEDALDLIVNSNQLAKKVVDAKTIVIYPNTPDKRREYQEQIVRVFYLARSEAKGAAAFLQSMLKLPEPFVDERNNLLALRDTPDNVQLAERLVALYDAGEPEVLLEVEVLEVNTSRLTELGVKFPNSFSLTPLPPTSGGALTLGNIRGLNRDRIGLGVDGLTVNLRRDVGDVTTLANPKIRAKNREKAKVMIGDRIPVITTTTGTGTFVAESVSYLDVGLKLDVEPTIYANDEVDIRVALEVSSVGSSSKTNSGTLVYTIGTRNASTLLHLSDGETQLLAGLISKEDRTTASRVPGAGDLPVLGRLFSNQTDNATRTELVLAITPRVLRNVRQPSAAEAELWVGTDAAPRLRLPPVVRAPAAALAAPATAGAGTPIAPAADARPPVGAMAAPTTETAAPAVAAARPAALKLAWRAPAQVQVGETFQVDLLLDAAAPMRAASVELGVDAEHLELLDVVEGDFLQRDGAAVSLSKGRVEDGRVRVGLRRSEADDVSGQGVLLGLRLKARAAGPAEVRVHAAQAIASGGLPPRAAAVAPAVLQVVAK